MMAERIETPNLTAIAIEGDALGWQQGTPDRQNPADAALDRINSSAIVGDPAQLFIALLADAADITIEQATALLREARDGDEATWWDRLRANWPGTILTDRARPDPASHG